MNLQTTPASSESVAFDHRLADTASTAKLQHVPVSDVLGLKTELRSELGALLSVWGAVLPQVGLESVPLRLTDLSAGLRQIACVVGVSVVRVRLARPVEPGAASRLRDSDIQAQGLENRPVVDVVRRQPCLFGERDSLLVRRPLVLRAVELQEQRSRLGDQVCIQFCVRCLSAGVSAGVCRRSGARDSA